MVYVCGVRMRCTYAVYVRGVRTRCTYAVYVRGVRTRCTYAVYVRGVRTRCTYTNYVIIILRGLVYLHAKCQVTGQVSVDIPFRITRNTRTKEIETN